MANEIPVYLFVGFLESGKTKFIQETFEDPNFDSGDKTLLLICEEGEEEYNEKKFAFPGVTVKVLEDKSELNPQNLAKLGKEADAGRVVIEYNGMWLLQDLADALPENWLVYQCIATADGTTALAFSRMRYADAQGDFGRAARQRQVINAIVKKGASKDTLLNFGKVKKVAEAALGSVTVDEKASTSSLMRMALAFKSASGDQGISGSVYWTDPDYYVDGVGSSVLLDEGKNLELFSELAKGTHRAGTVGTLAEQQS